MNLFGRNNINIHINTHVIMKKLFLISLTLLLWAGLARGQTSLPFFEGFEGVGSTTTFTSSSTSINGLGEWNYEQTANGRLRFEAGTGFYNTGNHAATLDASTTTATSINYLILTLDMSSYTKADVEMEFYFAQHGDESHSNDRVWIRGSNSDSWVELYNWYSNRPSNGTYTLVQGLDLDAALSKANQSFSTTTQIRFGQEDNFPATSTTSSDGFTVDDISIRELKPNNGAIEQLSAFCAGGDSLRATLTNPGTDTLKSASIVWSIDGTSQSDVKFKGAIPPKGSATVTLSYFNASNQAYDFVLVVDSANGVADEIKNDTLKVTSSPALNGSYTVAGTNADFSSLDNAFSALEQRGVCGPVTLTLNTQSHTGPFSLGEVLGVNATNTITIDGQDSSQTTLTHSGDNPYATLAINGTDYVIIENMKLTTTASNDGWGIHLTNLAEHITIRNCWFDMPNASSDVLSIVASGSGTSEFTSGENTNDLLIENNRIEGGEAGVHIQGNTGTFSRSITVRKNTFDRQYDTGLAIRYSSNVNVEDNVVDNLRASFGDAFYFIDIDDFVITRNNLKSPDWTLYLNDGNFGGSGRSVISNNLVYSSGDDAMYLNDIRNTDVYNNTVQGDPAIHFDDWNGIDCRNNIFIGDGGYAFETDATGGFNNLDFNVYYRSSGIPIDFDNEFASLDAWKLAFPAFNQNSIEDEPPFVSGSNLHLSASQQFYRATPILGNDIDVDGDMRCFLSHSMGADESTFPEPRPNASFRSPDTTYVDAKLTIYNSAKANEIKTYEWWVDTLQVSTDLHLNWQFDSTGSYNITLVTISCGGTDTARSTIYVDTVRSAAVADFVASERVIARNDEINFANLSENGADSFYWRAEPYWGVDQFGLKIRNYYYMNGTDSSSANPQIQFINPGEYEVCLSAENALGGNTECKSAYITVAEDAHICGTVNETQIAFGTLYDPAGPGVDYQGGQNYNCAYLIDACADELTLVFSEFDLRNGFDYLRIYDGSDANGTPLHTYNSNYTNGLTGDAAAASFKDTLIAHSGKAYIVFSTSSSVDAPGFTLEWSGTPLQATPPVANFNLPDTVCVNNDFTVENLSTGDGNRYMWDVDNNGTIDYTDERFSHTYFFAGTYRVKLFVENCGGLDSMLIAIEAIDPPTAPTAAYSQNKTRPNVGETVTLVDESSLRGISCTDGIEWIISPSTYRFANNTNAGSQMAQVIFEDTGCYDLILVAKNSAGDDSLKVPCFVNVKETCIPAANNTSSDIGISRVTLGDIDNKSTVGQSDFTDYQEEKTTLQIGGSYTIEIERPANPSSSLRRSVWIDYNQDGDFSDSLEHIDISSQANTLRSESFTFTIPGIALLGVTNLRVAVNVKNEPITACGPILLGEYEDYRVRITQDTEAPMIYIVNQTDTVLGSTDTTFEQCALWNDPGAYAIDNVNGRLPVNVTSTVDSTQAGTYSISYSAVDAAGNRATAVRTVEVISDTTSPDITLFGNAVDTVLVFNTYVDLGAEAYDRCAGTFSPTVSGTVDTRVIGTYTISYEASDNEGNTSLVERKVHVLDQIAPQIDSLMGADTIYLSVFDNFVEPGLSLSDNYYDASELTFNVSGTVNTEMLGEYTLVYEAVDPSGNISMTVERTVIVEDNEAPVLSLNGFDTLTLDVFDQYADMGYQLTDNYYDNSAISIKREGSFVDQFGVQGRVIEVGTFVYRYIATDGSGNSDTAERIIQVVDRVAPTIRLTGGSVVYIKRWDDWVDPGYSTNDNYWDPANITVDIDSNLTTQSEGVYYVEYTPTDGSGNVGQTVSRTVVVGPNSVDENLDENEIAIYPNPSNGMFKLEMRFNEKAQTRIAVYSQTGALIHLIEDAQLNSMDRQLDLSDLESGVYHLTITRDDERIVKRLQLVR